MCSPHRPLQTFTRRILLLHAPLPSLPSTPFLSATQLHMSTLCVEASHSKGGMMSGEPLLQTYLVRLTHYIILYLVLLPHYILRPAGPTGPITPGIVYAIKPGISAA